MRTVEIIELRKNLNEVVREVEQGETVDVARNGQVVAQLVPARPRKRPQRDIDEIIADIAQVAAEIGAQWPASVSAQDAIDDVRS